MSWMTIAFLLVVAAFLAWQRQAAYIFLQNFLPTMGRKLPIALLTLWFVATMVFTLTKLTGGEEEAIIREGRRDPQMIAALRAKYYLDRPVLEQYWIQMKKLAVLDTLPSRMQRDRTFRDVLHDHMPYTWSLGWRALVLAVSFGLPIGMLCAVWHNRWVDQGGMVLALLGVSVPSFVLASLAVFYLSRMWQLVPATSYSDPLFMWVPAACLGAFPFAAVLRLTRASMLEALREDYVRTARAKGVSELKVVMSHALRNSLSAVVTYVGPVTAGLLTGSLIVETIFDIPGTGDMFVRSTQNRDMPLIMGIAVFYCSLLVTANLIVDSIYPVLNPRLREK